MDGRWPRGALPHFLCLWGSAVLGFISQGEAHVAEGVPKSWPNIYFGNPKLEATTKGGELLLSETNHLGTLLDEDPWMDQPVGSNPLLIERDYFLIDTNVTQRVSLACTSGCKRAVPVLRHARFLGLSDSDASFYLGPTRTAPKGGRRIWRVPLNPALPISSLVCGTDVPNDKAFPCTHTHNFTFIDSLHTQDSTLWFSTEMNEVFQYDTNKPTQKPASLGKMLRHCEWVRGFGNCTHPNNTNTIHEKSQYYELLYPKNKTHNATYTAKTMIRLKPPVGLRIVKRLQNGSLFTMYCERSNKQNEGGRCSETMTSNNSLANNHDNGTEAFRDASTGELLKMAPGQDVVQFFPPNGLVAKFGTWRSFGSGHFHSEFASTGGKVWSRWKKSLLRAEPKGYLDGAVCPHGGCSVRLRHLAGNDWQLINLKGLKDEIAVNLEDCPGQGIGGSWHQDYQSEQTTRLIFKPFQYSNTTAFKRAILVSCMPASLYAVSDSSTIDNGFRLLSFGQVGMRHASQGIGTAWPNSTSPLGLADHVLWASHAGVGILNFDGTNRILMFAYGEGGTKLDFHDFRDPILFGDWVYFTARTLGRTAIDATAIIRSDVNGRSFDVVVCTSTAIAPMCRGKVIQRISWHPVRFDIHYTSKKIYAWDRYTGLVRMNLDGTGKELLPIDQPAPDLMTSQLGEDALLAGGRYGFRRLDLATKRWGAAMDCVGCARPELGELLKSLGFTGAGIGSRNPAPLDFSKYDDAIIRPILPARKAKGQDAGWVLHNTKNSTLYFLKDQKAKGSPSVMVTDASHIAAIHPGDAGTASQICYVTMPTYASIKCGELAGNLVGGAKKIVTLVRKVRSLSIEDGHLHFIYQGSSAIQSIELDGSNQRVLQTEIWEPPTLTPTPTRTPTPTPTSLPLPPTSPQADTGGSGHGKGGGGASWMSSPGKIVGLTLTACLMGIVFGMALMYHRKTNKDYKPLIAQDFRNENSPSPTASRQRHLGSGDGTAIDYDWYDDYNEGPDQGHYEGEDDATNAYTTHQYADVSNASFASYSHGPVDVDD